MGYFDADMEDMLDIYLLETNQLLEQADEILLNAEKEKSLSKEHINGIFRVMHTIKSCLLYTSPLCLLLQNSRCR